MSTTVHVASDTECQEDVRGQQSHRVKDVQRLICPGCIRAVPPVCKHGHPLHSCPRTSFPRSPRTSFTLGRSDLVDHQGSAHRRCRTRGACGRPARAVTCAVEEPVTLGSQLTALTPPAHRPYASCVGSVFGSNLFGISRTRQRDSEPVRFLEIKDFVREGAFARGLAR